jgi:hypothetical protein
VEILFGDNELAVKATEQIQIQQKYEHMRIVLTQQGFLDGWTKLQ